jgi:phosphatidylglycerophosphatase A
MIEVKPLPNGLRATDPAVILATWFGAGRLHPAPGTWGSIAALPVAWVLMFFGGPVTLGVAILIVFASGIWATRKYRAADRKQDPAAVVIDEVAGQWITLLAAGTSPAMYLIGLAAFRFFDIVKPWPVGWIDRNIKSAYGVMLDDVAAGAYGLIVVVNFRFFLNW